MSLYKCKLCSYSTPRYTDYKKHLTTKTHIKASISINNNDSSIEDSKGIIYLIQPCELIGTERYKIGCSKNSTLDRVKNGYKKGTRYLYISECINPLIIEARIKQEFNKNFKLITGREYYEGNENDIKRTFINIVNNNKNLNNFNNTNLPDNINNNLNTKNIILYDCKYCNKTYKHERSLYKHQRTNCKYIPITQKNMMINITNNNGHTKNKLKLLIPFSNINDIKTNNYHNNSINKIICEYCNKSYKSVKYLHNHYLKSCLKIPDKLKNRLIKKT